MCCNSFSQCKRHETGCNLLANNIMNMEKTKSCQETRRIELLKVTEGIFMVKGVTVSHGSER